MRPSTATKLNDIDVLIGIAYIENNLSITKAARQTHYAENTVQHRLKRIQRITGYNLRNPFNAVEFYNTYKEKDSVQ